MPAFTPNENNLGGAQEILDEYKNMQNKLRQMKAGPGLGEMVRLPGTSRAMSMAERLSNNRARRRAAVDRTAVEHINNVYHMHRWVMRRLPAWRCGAPKTQP